MTNEASNETKNAAVTDISQKEDISKLTNKDIKYRAQYKEAVSTIEELKIQSDKLKEEAQKAKEDADRKEADFQDKFTGLQKSKEMAEQKRIEAEMQAIAVSEGLTDTDLIKLADISNVKINEKGELEGAKEAIAAFKTAKPAFFTVPKKVSSSTNASTGADSVIRPKSAFDMSDEEFNATKKFIPHSI